MSDAASVDNASSAQVDNNSAQVAPGLSPTQEKTPAKLKMKIDGVEEEVDVDTLVRERQKYLASEKRFKEASEMKKQVDSLLQKAQQGDLSWLKGLVPQELINKWAESELLEYVEWEKKPEIERRALLAERRAQELEEKMTARDRENHEREQSALSDRAHSEIESDIVTAVKELGHDTRVTPRLIRRIAEQMYASLEVSEDPHAKPIPAKLATERAYKGLKIDAQELLALLPEQEALEMLPQKIKDALRKTLAQEAVSQTPFRKRETGEEGKEPVRKSKSKRMATDEWFTRMEKRFA